MFVLFYVLQMFLTSIAVGYTWTILESEKNDLFYFRVLVWIFMWVWGYWRLVTIKRHTGLVSGKCQLGILHQMRENGVLEY